MQKHSEELIERIRQEFVQGFMDGEMRVYPTIEELSKKHKIPAITLYRKSKEWKQQKIKFQQELSLEIDENKKKKMAKDAVDFDENNLRIAKALQNEIVALLSLSNKKRRENDDRPYLTASSLNSLGMALSTCQRVGRLALGESTDNTNVTTNESTVNEAFQLIEEILGSSDTKSKSELH